jgi:hypothetical protein
LDEELTVKVNTESSGKAFPRRKKTYILGEDLGTWPENILFHPLAPGP